MKRKSSGQVANFLAAFFATVGGVGLIPKAPGTWGSLVGLVLAYQMSRWSLSLQILLWAALFLISWWAVWKYEHAHRTRDNQRIVVDEVLGVFVPSVLAGQEWKRWVLAFVLFRIFDIFKFFPVHKLDYWSKNHPSAAVRSIGVIADDILAGCQAFLVILLLIKLKLLA